MASTAYNPKESIRKMREQSADTYPAMDPSPEPPKVAIGPDNHITCPYCGQCSIVDS